MTVRPEELPRVWGEAATATADLVARLGEVWADAAGREWADRLRQVGRELDDLAADMSGRPDELVEQRDPDERPGAVRLGALTGTRTTQRRGVVAPTLPPP